MVRIVSGRLQRDISVARTQDEIRQTNVKKILQAAEQLFAEKGYAGASMGDIAQLADLPKSNVHYYFSTKKALYQEVLLALLEVWKQDALCFELYDDPRVVLSTYIRAKMNHSRYRNHRIRRHFLGPCHDLPPLVHLGRNFLS